MTSEAVKALADKYCLKTGDQVAPPPPKPAAAQDLVAAPTAPPVVQRVRWSDEKKAAFKAWGLAALYVAGPKAPVPRGIGDNRLGWPLRFGTMRTWEDPVTRAMDAASPYHWQGIWFRVWTSSPAHVRQLLTLLVDALAPSESLEEQQDTMAGEIARWVRAERVKKSWLDVGPDFDLPMSDRKAEQLLGLPPLPRDASEARARERRFLVMQHKFKSAVMALATSSAIECWDDDGVEAALERGERGRMKREVQTRGGRR